MLDKFDLVLKNNLAHSQDFNTDNLAFVFGAIKNRPNPYLQKHVPSISNDPFISDSESIDGEDDLSTIKAVPLF